VYTENTDIEKTRQELRAAFDSMISKFQQARDAIDTPELYPPPATARNLAEGYRYVLGFMLNGIERALGDPMFPRFRRTIQPMNRSTIDNADAVYLGTEIDGEYSYVVRGKALDTRHWRGETSATGKTAPQYVIFELASDYSGDSGSLEEMRPGTRINTSTLDSFKLQVEADGSFEILIAPQKPADYQGNFMLSKRESHGKEYIGRFLTCRELFHDWENQDLIDLEILRIGVEQSPKKPLDPEGAVTLMKEAGRVARNQVHFWNAFNTITLETYGKVTSGDKDKAPFMPTNNMNPPNALGIATGGGQSSNIYSGGVYLLDDNEALIIETSVALEPCFMGFHLSNLWGESLDFESYQSSLNAAQMDSTSNHKGETVYRWVVSHRDPGIANWVDTTGLPHGYMALRWTYPQQPPKQQWPSLSVQKVAFSKIAEYFPAVRTISADERRANILMRHKHVQRRYRQY
jgi:hypothetical protein